MLIVNNYNKPVTLFERYSSSVTILEPHKVLTTNDNSIVNIVTDKQQQNVGNIHLPAYVITDIGTIVGICSSKTKNELIELSKFYHEESKIYDPNVATNVVKIDNPNLVYNKDKEQYEDVNISMIPAEYMNTLLI